MVVLTRGKGGPIKLYVWSEPEVVTQYVRVPKVVATVTKYVTAVSTKVVTLPASYISRVVSRWSAYESTYHSIYSSAYSGAGGDVSRTVSGYSQQLQSRSGSAAQAGAGVWGKYVSEANEAITLVSLLGSVLSESTYDSWMSALVAARKVLTDPGTDVKAKAKAALVIQLLYPQIINTFKNHSNSLTQILGGSVSRSGAGPGPGVGASEELNMATINIGGTTLRVPTWLAQLINERLQEVRKGKIPGKSPTQQAVYLIERALNTAAFWPQQLSESLASALESRAANTSNPYEKWFYQALAVATRAGGAASTVAWDTLLTALTGGLGIGVIAAAAADQFSRMATDPLEKEALKEAFTNPEIFCTKVLPIIIGSVVGGAASVKGLSAAREWVLENINKPGKAGALARILYRIGVKNGVFKPNNQVFQGDVTDVAKYSNNVDVKYDPESGIVRLVYRESGTAYAKGQVVEVDIPENVIRSVATKYGMSTNDVLDVIREFLSVYAKGNDEAVIDAIKEALKSGSNTAERVLAEVVDAIRNYGAKGGVYVWQDKIILADTVPNSDILRLEVESLKQPGVKFVALIDKNARKLAGLHVYKDGVPLDLEEAEAVLKNMNVEDIITLFKKAVPDLNDLWNQLESEPLWGGSLNTESFYFTGGSFNKVTVAVPGEWIEFAKTENPVLVVEGEQIQIPLKGIISEFKKYSFDKLREGVNVGKYRLQVTMAFRVPPNIAPKLAEALKHAMSDAVRAFRNGDPFDDVLRLVQEELGDAVGVPAGSGGGEGTVLMQIAEVLTRAAQDAAKGGESVTLPVIAESGSDTAVVAFATISASASAGASQATQQAQQSQVVTQQIQANLVNTAVTTIQRLKSTGVTQITAQDVMEMLGISASQAQQVMMQVANRLGLKTVEVPIQIPLQQTVTEVVPKIVVITKPETLNVAKSLREVIVPIQIPQPKEIIKEVLVPVTVDVPISASITKPLKLVPVEIDIPKPETIIKQVDVPVVIEDLTGLSITKPLRLVEVEVDIPRLKTVTVEVPKVVTIEDYTSASVPGQVIEIPVLKTITITVPYYKVVDIPVNINENTPPPPNKPEIPVPVPPATLPPLAPINYQSLPGTFRPPKRKRQEEVVMI